MILQLDRVDCSECDTSLDLISEEGVCFPKKTIYIKSISIPLENTPLKYYSFRCKKCGKVTKCLTLVKE